MSPGEGGGQKGDEKVSRIIWMAGGPYQFINKPCIRCLTKCNTDFETPLRKGRDKKCQRIEFSSSIKTLTFFVRKKTLWTIFCFYLNYILTYGALETLVKAKSIKYLLWKLMLPLISSSEPHLISIIRIIQGFSVFMTIT